MLEENTVAPYRLQISTALRLIVRKKDRIRRFFIYGRDFVWTFVPELSLNCVTIVSPAFSTLILD